MSERGEARNEALRAQLEPLAPGERPTPALAGALVCGGLAVANIVLAATGREIEGGVAYLPVFALLLAGLAVGLWRVQYWAALGLQGVCAITAIYAFLSLLVSANLAGAALSLAILVASGALFWSMVRVMGRIQAPGARIGSKVWLTPSTASSSARAPAAT